jgi:integrase
MSKPTKFKPIKTKSGWQLNIPSKYAVTGKRERHFYKTQALALAAAAKLKADREIYGSNAKTITPGLAEQAVVAAGVLEPWGVSLVEAARIVAAMRKVESASCPLDEAADAWIAACEGLRPKTILGYRQTANMLKVALGNRLLAAVTAADLQAALAPAGSRASAVAGHLRNGKALWHFSAKRNWCKVEVFAGVETPKGGTDAEIGFLTVAESKALLDTAIKHYPQAVPYYAIQLFGGVRVEEVRRLDARDVSTEGIELTAETTKKGRRRHVTPSPTLSAWLEHYPFEALANWPRIDRACRRLAGWDLAADMLKNPPAPTRGRWPQNALRHSHATYAVSAGVSIDALEFEFGHVEGAKLLRQHYVGRASKKEALAFFQLAPAGVKIPTLKIA